MSRLRLAMFAAAIGACGFIGCSSPPTTRALAHQALEAMGGADRLRAVRTLIMRDGDGSRWQLGQGVSATDEDAAGSLNAVTETLDLAGRRAALDYDIRMTDGFSQRRQEILTSEAGQPVGLESVSGRPLAIMSPAALFSWGTQSSPVLALRRNVIDLALAALSADASELAQTRDLTGRRVWFGRTALRDERIGLYFDPRSRLITAFETTDTDPIRGDVTARYLLDDYRPVGGILLPHTVTITKGGARYSRVHFKSANIDNTEALKVFDIPADVADTVAAVAAAPDDYSPMTLTAIADGVYFAQAYSHHSLVVEFPTYLAVVEAPYTEAQSKTLVRLLTTNFPAKPVRYVAVTHPHFDHIGGVRGLAAAGATVLVAQAHEPILRALLGASHTNPADSFETKLKTGGHVGTLQAYGDNRKVITDGDQTLELRVVTGSPHADPMVMAYVPKVRVLFQSDLFFPGTGAAATPASTHLLHTIQLLKLDVETLAGGHGGVSAFDELVKTVTGTTQQTPTAPDSAGRGLLAAPVRH